MSVTPCAATKSVSSAMARTTLERTRAIKEAACRPDRLEVAITLTHLGVVQRELKDQK
jgi:hypothetical protein